MPPDTSEQIVNNPYFISVVRMMIALAMLGLAAFCYETLREKFKPFGLMLIAKMVTPRGNVDTPIVRSLFETMHYVIRALVILCFFSIIWFGIESSEPEYTEPERPNLVRPYWADEARSPYPYSR